MRHRGPLWVAVLSLFVASAVAAASHHAPDFALPGLSGEIVTLSQARQGKKALLVNFWATWCPSCREEIPELVRLNRELAGRGFAVIGVDVAESPKRVSAYAAKHGIDYPVLIDADSETAESYGVVGLPTSVLIDRDGRVADVYNEFSDELERDVETALK